MISGTFAARRGPVDRSIGSVVDGAVNGTGWVTVISAWFSGLTDRTVVDGAREPGRADRARRRATGFRRLQTGLVQNYALLMLFGIFAFVSIYLFVTMTRQYESLPLDHPVHAARSARCSCCSSTSRTRTPSGGSRTSSRSSGSRSRCRCGSGTTRRAPTSSSSSARRGSRRSAPTTSSASTVSARC